MNRCQPLYDNLAGKSLEFLQLLQLKVASLSAVLCQFRGQVSQISSTFCNSGLSRCQLPYTSLGGKSPGFLQLLQFRIESLSAALCQFDGQVSWASATFASQG
jgi:hypothetical protein